MASYRRRKTTDKPGTHDGYPRELRLSDDLLREILSWDMTDVPHYTAAELMEPASVPEARSMAPPKRKRDSQH